MYKKGLYYIYIWGMLWNLYSFCGSIAGSSA